MCCSLQPTDAIRYNDAVTLPSLTNTDDVITMVLTFADAVSDATRRDVPT